MKKIFLFSILLLFINASLFAQQRADQLFNSRAYLDAATLYEKVDNKSQSILERLGDCYYFNTRMNDAVKWYKQLFVAHNNGVNSTYYFRYSQALRGVGNYQESDIWLNKYYKEKSQSNTRIQSMSMIDSLKNKNEIPFEINKISINESGSDFGTSTFGDKVVFASTRTGGRKYAWNNQPYLDLFIAEKDTLGNLRNVTLFSDEINRKGVHESNAIFTKDGKTMYFTRNNLKGGKKIGDKNNVTQIKIYKASLVDNEWTNIEELPFNSDEYSVEHPALSPDEKKLYFSSDMPGSIGSFDLFVVTIDEWGNYSSPKNLGSIINTELREQFPYISNKGSLYFASDGHFGLGGLDIFKSHVANSGFSAPQNLINLNSPLDDFSLTLNEETKKGYFSSNRKGGVGDDDIYRVTQKNDAFMISGTVKDNITYKIIPNSTLKVYSATDEFISERPLEKGVFSIELEKDKAYKLIASHPDYNDQERIFIADRTRGDVEILLSPPCLISGVVYDKTTNETISETLISLQEDDLQDSFLEKNSDINGSYNLKASCNRDYILKTIKEGYIPNEDPIMVSDGPLVKDIYLTKIADKLPNEVENNLAPETIDSPNFNELKGNNQVEINDGVATIKHNPIYFDVNSSYLRAASIKELNKIISFMKEHPKYQVECGSHTDSRDSDDYNKWLSERRAKRTTDYIISKGISADRIKGIGYGETKLVNKCANSIKCEEEEHQMNRRTEFVIVSSN